MDKSVVCVYIICHCVLLTAWNLTAQYEEEEEEEDDEEKKKNKKRRRRKRRRPRRMIFDYGGTQKIIAM